MTVFHGRSVLRNNSEHEGVDARFHAGKSMSMTAMLKVDQVGSSEAMAAVPAL